MLLGSEMSLGRDDRRNDNLRYNTYGHKHVDRDNTCCHHSDFFVDSYSLGIEVDG